jgi:enamine deaminase RidA (YjgF/YER057c/UK114 family)
MDFDDKLDELFIDLPEPSESVGFSVSTIRVGKMLFVGGVLPLAEGRVQSQGKVGVEIRLDNARLAARTAGVMTLAIVAKELGGSLSKIKRVVSLDAQVACAADFGDHLKVIDGASELFNQIFGPFGKHVRTVCGVTSLPKNACVQITTVFELK